MLMQKISRYATENTSAINMMTLNKSPGLGGLTVGFYQTFWD
jgi:hypothetical protein